MPNPINTNYLKTANDPRWQAVLASAHAADVHFYYSVKSTGAYCQPSCPAHAAKPKNVQFHLSREESVTADIYNAGHSANSRIRFALGECSLGSILVAASEIGICAIALGGDLDLLARELQDRFPQAELIRDDHEFDRWVAKVVGFIEAPAIGLNLPLDIRGTAFQQRVWQTLRQIPVGEKVSYTDIAQRIGVPKAVRAVASACAANILAVAIPCHRVVRSDGSLSGYRWGMKRKAELLRRENPA